MDTARVQGSGFRYRRTFWLQSAIEFRACVPARSAFGRILGIDRETPRRRLGLNTSFAQPCISGGRSPEPRRGLDSLLQSCFANAGRCAFQLAAPGRCSTIASPAIQARISSLFRRPSFRQSAYVQMQITQFLIDLQVFNPKELGHRSTSGKTHSCQTRSVPSNFLFPSLSSPQFPEPRTLTLQRSADAAIFTYPPEVDRQQQGHA